MATVLTCGLVSLGCPKNLVDSEVMLGFLSEAGLRVTSELSQADVLIVNTCAFLRAAIDESLQVLRQAAVHKRNGRCRAIIAAGCLPLRDLQLIQKAVPEVDGLVGVGDVPRIAEIVEDCLAGGRPVAVSRQAYISNGATPRLLATPPWTAYVKIAEGCSQRCSFCVIPQIRGPLRSRPIESIVNEARVLSERGVKEIVLVSQDSTEYGVDLYGRPNLHELVASLAEVESVEWLRILYCNPGSFSDMLIDAIAKHRNVCKYVDIPMQHAHPEILRSMRRNGSPEAYAKLVEKLRERIPGVAIRSVFIVGFPGETGKHFDFLLQFVRDMEFDRLSAFRYSREAETPSARFADQVPDDVAEERYHRLMQMQQEISLRRNKSLVGKEMRVLIEQVQPAPSRPHAHAASPQGCSASLAGPQSCRATGRSESDAPDVDATIRVDGCCGQPGDMITVRITRAGIYDLYGKQV